MLIIHGPLVIVKSSAANFTEDTIELCLNQFAKELSFIEKKYDSILLGFNNQLTNITADLVQNNRTRHTLELLVKQFQIRDSVDKFQRMRIADINKVRYIKGVEIIKILYEKTLALDHHFTTVNTLHDIQKMSNPNNYQEFTLAKGNFSNKADKKKGFDLGAILGDNIYTTIIHSMISLFTNDGINKSSKKEMMKEIECILDFTLRINNDLNVVYFESAYLKKSNEEIIQQIEELFNLYTRPIDYKISLKKCRENDDWLTIQTHLVAYLNRLNYLSSAYQNPIEAYNMKVDLEFCIDRLTHFIFQYNMFINQSGKFYEKFALMLDSYKNEEACVEKIPEEFVTLKEKINITIEKFHNTYKPVEINGSKMKQLLYGVGGH